MTPDDELDPLADLFGDIVPPSTNAALREAIFQQTRSVLRRRRWLRYGTRVGTFVACYAVGLLSGLAWQPPRANNPFAVSPIAEVEVKPSASTDKSEPAPDVIPLPPEQPRVEPTQSHDEPPKTFAQVEPSDASLTTFEKMRRAGDRQLNERGNLQAAIGCYRRALDYAKDDELQIVPERDSWLLIPLKEARLEARKHVHKKS
jgi:hypothetical protein